MFYSEINNTVKQGNELFTHTCYKVELKKIMYKKCYYNSPGLLVFQLKRIWTDKNLLEVLLNIKKKK